MVIVNYVQENKSVWMHVNTKRINKQDQIIDFATYSVEQVERSFSLVVHSIKVNRQKSIREEVISKKEEFILT